MILQEHQINGRQIFQVEQGKNIFSLVISPDIKETGVSFCTAILYSSINLSSNAHQLKVKGIASVDVINTNTLLLYKFPWSDWEEIFSLVVTNSTNQL